MRHFHFDNADDYWTLFNNSSDRNKLVTDISLFATSDFGNRSSEMMAYQQAAMQWLKDFVKNGCGQKDDVF